MFMITQVGTIHNVNFFCEAINQGYNGTKATIYFRILFMSTCLMDRRYATLCTIVVLGRGKAFSNCSPKVLKYLSMIEIRYSPNCSLIFLTIMVSFSAHMSHGSLLLFRSYAVCGKVRIVTCRTIINHSQLFQRRFFY